MSRTKMFVTLILMIFCFTAFANQSEAKMSDKKTLVISYDYPQEKVLKESTTHLHRTSQLAFHGQGNFDLHVMGEKHKIDIPGLSESFLLFDKNFNSAELYLLPVNQWLTLEFALGKINKMKEVLKPLKEMAINTQEFDTTKLTADHFKNEDSEIISKYDLEHYKIFFLIKKLNTPKELYPRDQDYYQLTIRVDNKNI